MSAARHAPEILTSAAALARGWRLETTGSGRLRVYDERNRKYQRTWPRPGHQVRADVVITFADPGLPPLYLRRCERPAHLQPKLAQHSDNLELFVGGTNGSSR